MTRILVQRGSGSSSSNQSRPSSSSVPQSSKEEEQEREVLQESSGLDELIGQVDELVSESSKGIQINTGSGELSDREKPGIDEDIDCMKELDLNDLGGSGLVSSQIVIGESNAPPPPVPPPRPPTASNLSTRRTGLSGGNAGRVGSPRRQTGWPVVSTWSSPSGSRPSSPRSYAEGKGYNSADEQGPCFVSSYDDVILSLRRVLRRSLLSRNLVLTMRWTQIRLC